jgi:hypothetical protein
VILTNEYEILELNEEEIEPEAILAEIHYTLKTIPRD